MIYTLQNNGNIGHIKLTPGSGTNTFNQFFVYDELNRLKLAKEFATPPNAPTNLQIDPNGGYNFILSWTDNSDNESGFFIERSRNGGPYEFIGLSFTNQNTFFDNPPGFNTNHCYRVRAFIGDINNVVDLEDLLSSDYSNISCATTGPEPPNPCDQCDEPDPDPGICDCCDADGCIRIFNFVGTGLPGYKGDSKLAIDAQLFGVSSISISPTGELFLADTNNRVIRKVDTTNIISTVVGNGKEALSNQTDVSAKSLSLSNTNSIVTNPKTGEMFFLSKNLINKFSTSTDKLSVVAGSGRLNPSLSSSAKDSNLGSPSFIDFDNQGNLYLVSQTKEKLSQIFKIDSNGKIISILGKDTPSSLSSNIKDSSFSTITAFAVDKANGDIYFTDSRELIVKKLSSKTGEISNFFGGGTNAIKTGIASTSVSLDQTPTALLVSSSGTVYVATSKAGTKASIYSINPDLTFKLFAGGLIRYPVIKDSDSVDLVLPKGLALDKEGNLFVADSARHRVLFLSKDGAKTTPSQPSSSVNVINEPPINPLVGPNTSSWSQAYSYDRYGNRLSVEGTNAQSLNISAGKNRINDAGYEYDLAGNLTKDPSDKFYFYDAENRLVKVSIDQAGSNIIAQYFYDGNGWRIKKASSSTTRFVYDQGGRLLSEYDGEPTPAMNAPTREHIYGASGMLATVEPDKINYHTPDHLGSPRILTDASGSVISRRDHYPFGEQILDSIGNRSSIPGYSITDSIKQRFTGYFKDEESGLDFAKARYYENTSGRFTSIDPFRGSSKVGNPQTLNLYIYTLNNPINFTDPLGLEPEKKEGFFSKVGKAFKAFGTGVANKVSSTVVKLLRLSKEPEKVLKEDVQVYIDLAGDYQEYANNPTEVNDAIKESIEQGNLPTAVAEAAGEVVPDLLLGKIVPVPPFVYRQGTASPSNLTPRASDFGKLSFRDSVSNPYPLLPEQRPVFDFGKDFIKVDTSKLPAGSVIPDNVPPGHVSIQGATPEQIKAAVVEKGKLPKKD